MLTILLLATNGRCRLPGYTTATIFSFSPELRAVELAEFLALELPPREDLIAPWLPVQGLAMIHAPRGVGKTHVSLGLAYAVASGGSFLRWSVPKPRGVLFIDGEMPAGALQQRLAEIASAADTEPSAPLRLITPDLNRDGMPDLSTDEGQQAVDELVDDSET